jgi:peptidoglycan/LPS O-acetylase OafA/YrhL
MSGAPRDHLRGFDGLRAIAATAVVLYHAAALAQYRAEYALLRVPFHLAVGVWIFFVISGVLLYQPWARAHAAGTPPPALATYLRSRVLRIYPAYLVALCVTLAWRGFASIGGLGDFLIHAALLQIYSTGHVFGGIPQAWSLATEVSFYAFLPAYAAAVRGLGSRIGVFPAELAGVVVLLVGGFGFRFWAVLTQQPLAGSWLPAYLGVFGLGMFLAVAIAHHEQPVILRLCRIVQWQPLLWWLGAAALMGVLVGVRSGPTGMADELIGRPILLDTVYPLVALGIVLPVALQGERSFAIVRWLTFPAVAWLGSISYGVFLWHYHVLRLVEPVAATGGPEARMLWYLVAGVPLTVAVSALSWWFVEQPARRWGRLPMAARAATVGSGGN